MLNIGIFGAGQVGERHALAYADHAGARIVGIADTDPARAEHMAARFGARPYSSYEDLLNREQLDAVSVCLPHDLHLPVTRAAVAKRVHLLMEKPIANTLQEADEMLALVDTAGVKMMVCFVHRFRNEVMEAKRLLATGAIGTPTTVLDKFCSLGGAHPPAWVWRHAQAGGGVLMYGGIHAVDRLLWMLDAEPVSVTARVHHTTEFAGEVEDGVVAMLSFATGATAAMFENSPPYGRVGGWETELFGAQGALRIRNGEYCELTARDRKLTVQSQDDRNFHRMVAEFIAAIEEDREPSVSGHAGRQALAVALAIYRSAELGEPVQLPSATGA